MRMTQDTGKASSSARYRQTLRPKVLERLTKSSAPLFCFPSQAPNFRPPSSLSTASKALLGCGWSGEGVEDMFNLQTTKALGLNIAESLF
jgi:hypothetical protein